MSEYFTWVLSIVSILMLWLMGKKSVWGPAVGLAGQVLWVYYVVITDQWGLMPGTIIYAVIHGLNLIKWLKQARVANQDD